MFPLTSKKKNPVPTQKKPRKPHFFSWQKVSRRLKTVPKNSKKSPKTDFEAHKIRAGFRHVQHVRPNRGPHTLGAPTYGQNFFFVLSIFSIVVDSNYFMLITTESQMQVMVAGVVGRGGQPQVGENFDLHPPPPVASSQRTGQFKGAQAHEILPPDAGTPHYATAGAPTQLY